MNIIQLYGVDGNDVGLFSYDPSQHSAGEAANIIENAVEAAYQKEEAGELGDVDVLSEAQEVLQEKFNIRRIYAGIANTDRL